MAVQQLSNYDGRSDLGWIPDQTVCVSYAPGYLVGRNGIVWTCWKRGRYPVQTELWNELAVSQNRAGYCYVRLRIVSEKRMIRVAVHHLVLEHFVGPRPEGLEGCHKDNVKWNNVVENLFWGTHQKNVDDAVRDGLFQGREHTPTKVTPFTEKLIRALFREGWSGSEIAERVGFGRTLVYKVIKRNGWNRDYNVCRSRVISERVFELIWDSLRAGIPHKIISEDHGVSRALIGQIAKGWIPTMFARDSKHVQVSLDLEG